MQDNQPPLLHILDGGDNSDSTWTPPPRATVDPELWDAWAELALGQVIGRMLAAAPPPAESQIGPDLHRWVDRLLDDGQARLAAAGLDALRAV